MPKPSLKKASLLLLATTCLAAVIINSCKKDVHVDQQNKVSDPTIAQAKSWYESTYPAGNNQSGHLVINATHDGVDFSQLIKPDWQQAINYPRQNKQVTEAPLDPVSSKTVSTALRNFSSGNIVYKKEYSRSSFVLLNNGQNFKAYIMVTVADSAYLKGDMTKLERNTYQKREADFSGAVFYLTPKGSFVNGWFYKNGCIVNGISAQQNAVKKDKGPAVQSIDEPTETGACISWYADYYYNGEVMLSEYLGTTCDGSGGSGGSGGGGIFDPSDGGGGSGGGSGTETVDVPVPNIIDSLSKKYPCTGALITSLPNMQSDLAKLIYQAFGSKNGDDIIFLEGDKAYFTANSKDDGYTEYENGVGKIYINPNVLANASNEYRLVTLYHEALHAYLDLQLLNLGEDGFKAKYPAVNIVQRPNFSGNVKNQYDYYFDQGTTMAKVDPKHRTMADYFTDELRDAILAYNPNFPVDRATALARGGIFLNDTGNLYYNTAEKDVTKGNSVGTKCTP